MGGFVKCQLGHQETAGGGGKGSVTLEACKETSQKAWDMAETGESYPSLD